MELFECYICRKKSFYDDDLEECDECNKIVCIDCSDIIENKTICKKCNGKQIGKEIKNELLSN